MAYTFSLFGKRLWVADDNDVASIKVKILLKPAAWLISLLEFNNISSTEIQYCTCKNHHH